ncbi:MAG: ATP-binding cassette domain-containing protein [Rhizobiales bacterium]|nr:ATP-binding cassette domain-containing protein [Hyphomicrobiales bacterium]
MQKSVATSSPDPTQPGAKVRRRLSLTPVRALLPYLSRYRGMVALTIAALVVSALATLALPLGVRRMVDFGFAGSDPSLIDTYFATIIAVGLVLAAASAVRFYAVTWLGERVIADLRRDIFARLASHSPAFFERTHSGEVMSRLTADTTQIKTAIGTAISQSLRNGLLFVGGLTMMVVTSPHLAGLVLLAIPAIVLPLMAYGRAVRRLSRDAQDSLATASAYAQENLGAVQVMQAFNAEPAVVQRFSTASEVAFETARRRTVARAGLTAIAISLVFASIVGVLWYGASEVLAGTLTAGRLSQFVLYALFAAGALGNLAEVWGEVQQTLGAGERLTELLESRPEIVSPPEPVAMPVPPRGEIVFDGVGFAYPARPETAALDGVDIRIAPGETVAIVGPSGAGKSTLFNLLLRFYDPIRGEVRIDGVATHRAALADLRARMAYVPQDVVLFADTIEENIRYARPQASFAEVAAAAGAAHAAGFIEALPQGYHTRLGERGITLSGGQRQRIAIARAILAGAPILLLDEATSALDAESETLVQSALENAMAERTTLVIAHRLATVQKADRILVLDGGRIVEEGRHSDLIERGGVYARLAALQFTGLTWDSANVPGPAAAGEVPDAGRAAE